MWKKTKMVELLFGWCNGRGVPFYTQPEAAT